MSNVYTAVFMCDSKLCQWCTNFDAGFMDNHLQKVSSVKDWLKAQAAAFYDEGIAKLVPQCDK